MNKVKSGLFLAVLILTCGYASPAQVDIRKPMLEEVNKLRRSGCNCGQDTMPPVPDLVWNAKLEKSAGRHAKDMFENNLTGHIGSNGSSPGERITHEGYQWSGCGENVAYGYSSVKDVVDSWKISKGHCRNIMSADFRELGAAREGMYWVQDFGRAHQKKRIFKISR